MKRRRNEQSLNEPTLIPVVDVALCESFLNVRSSLWSIMENHLYGFLLCKKEYE